MSVSGLALLTSFAAGIVSFLSPCVLPLVPGYVSYVAGQSTDSGSSQASTRVNLTVLRLSVFFVLGFSTVFVILGASATALGQLLLSLSLRSEYSGRCCGDPVRPHDGGVDPLAFAAARFSLPPRPSRRPPGRGVCPWPGLRLRMDAVHRPGFRHDPDHQRSIGHRLAGYGSVEHLFARLRAAIPRIRHLHRAAIRPPQDPGRAGRILQAGAGGVVVAMGVAMLTGQLTAFSYWLLDTFPALARIG